MITIFALPRPFKGEFNTIQRNAIKSWTLLKPKCEIILLGDESGNAEAAKEFNVKHIKEIRRNEFGTPLIDDIYNKAQREAKGEIIAKLNSDIVLMDNFSETIKELEQIQKGPFLLVGQRWNLDIKGEINFADHNWQNKLKEKIETEGKILGLSGMDYWVFPREVQFDFPPFTEGRFATDGWIAYQAKIKKIPIIDATGAIDIIHQNHSYPQLNLSFYEVERKRNLELAGGLKNMLTLRDADFIFDKEGLKKPPFPRRIFSELSLFYPWRYLLSIKRRLQ